MYNDRKKKNNIIIGSLCAVVLLMVVGYAAFQSVLNITGTSKVSSNWKIQITNIETRNIVGGASNASDPTGVGTLTATFNTNLVSPGDSLEYFIEIVNYGTLDARLDKITVSDTNNPAIKFETRGLTEGDVLAAGSSADFFVKVTYDNAVTSQPESTKSELKVTLDYVQEGSGTTVPTNNAVYRYTTDKLNVGDSIEGVETTTDPSTLGKNIFLKHIIKNNVIDSSEVCFIKDGTTYCLKSHDVQTSQDSVKNIFGENACHGLYTVTCTTSDGYISVNEDGSIYVSGTNESCSIENTGIANCS